jgi:two-component system sensor histidine kinase QseC
LLALALASVVVVWLGASALTWIETRHEVDELLDGHLAQAAAMLVMQQAGTDDDDDDPVGQAPTLHKYAPRVAFQVYHDGRLTMRSANVSALPMTAEKTGFSTVTLADGAEWRVFSARTDRHDVQVHVAEQMQSRHSILWAVLRGMLLPLLVALPLLALMLWWAIRQGLLPLRLLGQVLAQRQAQSLEPLASAGMPLEMQPMLDSLNGLFARIDQLLASERRFTAYAAHELRTPMAAIRAQAQVALGAGADVAQRDHALQVLLQGCDRATHLVDQLLTLSRLEAAGERPASEPLDLCELVRVVAAELAPDALRRQQQLEFEPPDAANAGGAPAPCAVSGNAVLVSVLVRNLIDNASRYSPRHSRIVVSVTLESGCPTLRVQDSGPGISPDNLARLGERFFRVLGSEQTGSGLGWSIIRQIAAAFSATVEVRPSILLGGLCVTVRFCQSRSEA